MESKTYDIESFFSPDYFSARRKFIDAATNINAIIKSIKHPFCKGPDGEDLYIDYVKCGPEKAKTLIVLICGTHGPEAYAGSAVQTGILRHYKELFSDINYKFAFIHAHNPFGFAWNLRFNEDNIDLNRNYVDDFLNNLPTNHDYRKLHQIISLSEFNEEEISQSHSQLLRFAKQYGFESLKSALTKGQYEYPDGIYYGGNKPSWSNLEICKIFEEITIGIDNLIVIDIHTGLGNFGEGELITGQDLKSAQAIFAKSIWGDELTSTKSNSLSSEISGSIDTYIHRKYSNLNTAAIAIEFGTLDPLSVLKATQGANYLITNNKLNSEISKEIRTLSKEAFYPQDFEWKQKVFEKTIKTLKAIKLEKL